MTGGDKSSRSLALARAVCGMLVTIAVSLRPKAVPRRAATHFLVEPDGALAADLAARYGRTPLTRGGALLPLDADAAAEHLLPTSRILGKTILRAQQKTEREPPVIGRRVRGRHLAAAASELAHSN